MLLDHVYYTSANWLQGDSGGPLVCLKSTSDIYTLAGVTSFARNGCQLTDSPGVFTRVSHYIDWIQDHVGGNAVLCRSRLVLCSPVLSCAVLWTTGNIAEHEMKELHNLSFLTFLAQTCYIISHDLNL